MTEPYYDGEWNSEPADWYPGDDGWPYPDHGDIPCNQTFTVRSDELHDRITEDDPVETDDPYDMRGWS